MNHPAAASRRSAQVYPFPQVEASFVLGLADAEDREEIVDGRVRRYYRLTGDGATRLAAEAERLQRHARAATVRLRAAGSGGTA